VTSATAGDTAAGRDIGDVPHGHGAEGRVADRGVRYAYKRD
jgi:hypothetical protein